MPIAALIHRPYRNISLKSDYDKRRGNAYQRGYGGNHWQRRRRETFLRDNYVCQECGELCIEGDRDWRRRPHCDHIKPKPEGKDDIDNLQTLCGSCHSIKTIKGRGI